MMVASKALLAALMLSLFPLVPAFGAEQVLTIYTSRKDELIKPQLEEFTKKTGIKVEMLYDEAPKLIARLESEGKDSPADVLMPADVANMELAASKGLLAPTKSDTLNAIIPEALRDKDGKWYGLGQRLRVVFFSKEKVKPSELSTYEDLADPKWKGQILVRSSSHPYNLSLIAAMIAEGGAEKAESWAKGITANLARAPQGGDTDQIRAVAAGEAKLAIANSYYYARMLNSPQPEMKEAAAKVGIFFPNQNPAKGELQGAHLNLSGAGVVSTSQHKELAVKFIEYLASEEGQRLYADSNFEYPVNAKVEPSATLKNFGAYKADARALPQLAGHVQEAIRIADRSGWK
ncbi:MAG: extracellular solute-binding protein [Rickettsiales bacterium]|jgi:iron(III) transport system substrate-binding protein|nr:extracellular solute-binding protein [Rickettsiales bacterium]